MFVMAALALVAVQVLDRFADLPWCVSRVALAFTVGCGLGQGLARRRKPASRRPALECD